MDVATATSRKLNALGWMWALLTLFPLLVLTFSLFDLLLSAEPTIKTHHLVHVLGLALMPLMGWFTLGNAVQRFHAASTEGRYFRAGPGGISVCVPDNSTKATFLFNLGVWKFDLSWEHVMTWYPFTQSINGIPTERTIVFETLKGEKIKIPTFNFAERQELIAENISRAKSIMETISRSEDSPSRDLNNALVSGDRASLPPGAAEPQFQINKKREMVQEVDLRTVAPSERGEKLERVADAIAGRIDALFPPKSGYKFFCKRYRPFREWANVFGVRLYVRCGLLEGYEVQLEPNDPEYRTLTISLYDSNLISDIRNYIVITLGVAFLLISLNWVNVIRYSLGEFAAVTPMVLLMLAAGAIGVCMGLLQLPINLLLWIGTDKHQQNREEQHVKEEIKEIISEAIV